MVYIIVRPRPYVGLAGSRDGQPTTGELWDVEVLACWHSQQGGVCLLTDDDHGTLGVSLTSDRDGNADNEWRDELLCGMGIERPFSIPTFNKFITYIYRRIFSAKFNQLICYWLQRHRQEQQHLKLSFLTN